MTMDFALVEVRHYKTNEGTVIDYRLAELHIITYADDTGEHVWGYGDTLEKALRMAEEKWNRLIGGENPFTVILRKEGECF